MPSYGLLSLVASVALGALGWIATNFIARPILRAYELRVRVRVWEESQAGARFLMSSRSVAFELSDGFPLPLPIGCKGPRQAEVGSRPCHQLEQGAQACQRVGSRSLRVAPVPLRAFDPPSAPSIPARRSGPSFPPVSSPPISLLAQIRS